MKSKAIAVCALAALVASAQVSPAMAYDHHHDHWGHGGPLLGLVALGTAVVAGTVAIASAPFNAIAAAAPAPGYGYAEAPQQQAYYAPAPVAYAQPPVYYAQPQVVYAQPQVVYAQQPYYEEVPAYYHRGYYRY